MPLYVGSKPHLNTIPTYPRCFAPSHEALSKYERLDRFEKIYKEGEYVMGHIELPYGYDLEDIDLSTLMLNREVPAGDWPWEIEDENGIPELKVKFNRSAVQELLKVGKKESIVITGQLNDGTWFGGEDRIRVIKEAE